MNLPGFKNLTCVLKNRREVEVLLCFFYNSAFKSGQLFYEYMKVTFLGYKLAKMPIFARVDQRKDEKDHGWSLCYAIAKFGEKYDRTFADIRLTTRMLALSSKGHDEP